LPPSRCWPWPPAWSAAIASAATVRVQAGQDLQAAVQAAAPGDVVEVERGFYRVNLRIDKPLTLRGIDRPTLSGGHQGDTIRVTAPDVVIEGLIVRDSGTSLKDQNAGIYIYPGAHRAVVRKNDLTYNLFGLWIEKADDVLIEHNLITGKRDVNSSQRGNGIQLYNTTGARIEGNNISFVRDALYVDVSHHAIFRGNKLHHSRYGTHYMNSYYNLWEDNDTYLQPGRPGADGSARPGGAQQPRLGQLRPRHHAAHLQDAVIENNVVADNRAASSSTTWNTPPCAATWWCDNVVGVHLSAGSTRNKVEGNDFIGNREQVRYVGARDERWGTEGGNHWSNYLGWDRDGDGVGDVPYEANDMVDRLTWRHPTIKLLLASPAVQALRLVGQQFPCAARAHRRGPQAPHATESPNGIWSE
jgi:nitrous oxidase accessory protein